MAHAPDGTVMQQITGVLTGLWPGGQVHFAQDGDLVAGIAIEVAGKQIRWDIRHYLDRFHDGLADSLERESLPE